MATQKGLYKVRGTMDDSSFYKTRDGYIVRTKSSLTKERVMTDPRFENLQRQMKEFAGAGKSALLFRNAISTIMGKCKDGRVSSRLTKLMSKVVKGDSTSTLGLRNVADGDLTLLKDFDFNIDAPLTSVFRPVFTITVNRATGVVTIDIPAFAPDENLDRGPQATHFRVISAGLEINFAECAHVVSGFESAALPIDNVAGAAITITHTLSANSTQPLFALLGIKFYMAVNGINYLLNNSAFNAFRIVDVNVV